MIEARQIPLRLKAGGVTFDDFYAGPDHGELILALRSLADGQSQDLMLCGSPGSGKSHLLQACAASAADAFYIDLKEVADADPGAVLDISGFGLVCLDSLDSVAGDAGWERALFRFYNERPSTQRLVVAGRWPPLQMALQLPDLRSRLQQLALYRAPDLDDDSRRKALIFGANKRAMPLDEALCDYLLARVPRDGHALFGLLNHLEHETLVAKRRLTVPFLRQLLETGTD